MTFSPDQGSRVFIADNERLDKPDFIASTAQFNQELVARVLGGLIGSLGSSQFGGCVTAPSTSWDNGTKFLTIGGAIFYQGGTVDSPSGARAGRVIAYDPTKPWQVSLTGIDLTAEAAGSTTCVIWATRTDTANGGPLSSTDTRKRWLPAASAETSFSTSTRSQDVIGAFVAVSATFDGSGDLTAGGVAPSSDYFPVCAIKSWPAGVPTVTPISVWDGAQDRSLIGVVQSNVQALGAPSLGYISALVRASIARLYDNTGTTNWITAAGGAYSGLKQIDAEITALEDRTETCVIASGYVRDSAGWGIGAESYNLTFTSRTDGLFVLAVTALPASVARIVAVHVNFRNQTSPTINNTLFMTVSPPTTIGITAFSVGFWTLAGNVSTAPDSDGFTVTVIGGV